MRSTWSRKIGSLGLAVVVVLGAPLVVAAQDWRPLPPEQRCPSRWGAADERGAANLMTPETVMRAVRLIKEGKVVSVYRVDSVIGSERRDHAEVER
jgi:hypothetical protein